MTANGNQDQLPLVSICMPAYNAGKYVSEAVNSIIDQSYKNWELIIVNDGSTDNTAVELEKITDIRIKIHHQINAGQCAAANKAFSLSTGDLIKFMDADDIISPDFILNQVNQLNGRDDVIASAAWGRFYNDDISTFKLANDLIKQDHLPIDWLVTAMYNKQVMLQCALWLIPRTVLNRSGLWDEKLSLINDFEFIIRVLLNSKQIQFTDDAILYYRSGLENSLSTLKSRKGAESAYSAIHIGTTQMLQHENSDRVKKIAADCFQNFVYTFYPFHKDLIDKAETRIKVLGGSNSPFLAGGYTKILKWLVGWKATKRIKMLLQKKQC